VTPKFIIHLQGYPIKTLYRT